MTGPSNGYGAGRLPGREVDLAEEMAAYDRLPAGVQALIREMPMDLVALTIEGRLAALTKEFGAEDGEKMVEKVLVRTRDIGLEECQRLSEEACAR